MHKYVDPFYWRYLGVKPCAYRFTWWPGGTTSKARWNWREGQVDFPCNVLLNFRFSNPTCEAKADPPKAALLKCRINRLRMISTFTKNDQTFPLVELHWYKWHYERADPALEAERLWKSRPSHGMSWHPETKVAPGQAARSALVAAAKDCWVLRLSRFLFATCLVHVTTSVCFCLFAHIFGVQILPVWVVNGSSESNEK